ncbi:MAG TPA: hypothetical protein PLN89_06315 [Elusimicrobiota bacterium]|nr:hypothetical protein [Elusimicrobiota bacterium]
MLSRWRIGFLLKIHLHYFLINHLQPHSTFIALILPLAIFLKTVLTEIRLHLA